VIEGCLGVGVMEFVMDRCCGGERRKVHVNEMWALFIHILTCCLVPSLDFENQRTCSAR